MWRSLLVLFLVWVTPSMAIPAEWRVDAEFSGRGNGWTDISADVLSAEIRIAYGLMGAGPNDLVSGPGTFSLSLDNSQFNSAGLIGYYSLLHLSKRTGFGDGIGVRISVEVGSNPRRYKFVGTIDSILPVAGAYGRRATLITVTDWMDYASITKVSGLGIELNRRSDELFALLVASLAIQPRAVEIVAGKDTYPFAFDNLQDESRTVLTELNRLAQSERGRIFIKGDTVQGGTLTFEPRGARLTTLTNVDVFEDDAELTGLTAQVDRSHVVNRAQVITNQRRLGATDDEILYNSETRIAIEPQSTLELFAPYRDPLAEAERIAAIDVQEPVAGTDFTATENEDGSGEVLTSFVTVDVGDDGNGAHVEIVNSSIKKAWVWLRILGRGLYTYRTTVNEAEDATSIAVRGERTLTINMPYQSNVAVADAVVRYTVQLWKSPLALPVAEFVISHDEIDLLDRVLRREISDRVGFVEQVTGIKTTTTTPVVIGYFINAIEIRIVQNTHVVVRWTLQPSDPNNYWRNNIAGSANVGLMMVAPGNIIGHSDVGHGDETHVNIGHGDSAHVDTAHADSAHVDHTDGGGSHADTAHADSAHGDSAHGDETTAHDDDPHEDDAHVDTAHSDSAHGDTAHDDTAHEDHEHGDHDDVGHQDHEDIEHGDHTDGEFVDPHDDTTHVDDVHVDGPEHVDNAHVDESHGDEAHEDVAHEDSASEHTDTAHTDDDHSDVAHLDHTDATHGDLAHGDTAHSDTAHTDTPHQDEAHLDSPHGDEG